MSQQDDRQHGELVADFNRMVMRMPIERLRTLRGGLVLAIAVDVVNGQPRYQLVHPFDDDEVPNILVQALEQCLNEGNRLGVRFRVHIDPVPEP